MFLEIIIIISIGIIIYNNNERKQIINIVLSKLDISFNHHKIIMKDNKIFIKCHYYSKDNSSYLYNSVIEKNIYKRNNLIIKNNDSFYINNYQYGNEEKDNTREKILNNYDPNKNIGIIAYDIMIDMKTKKYKIITSYFEIINFTDNDYKKIINYLENPDYYIEINNIFDKDYNIIDMERNFEPFYNKFNNYYKLNKFQLDFHLTNQLNINITNDKNKILINPILIQINPYPNLNIQISPEIDIKPHINNNSFIISKSSGSFI